MAKKPIVLGSPEAAQVLKRDKEAGKFVTVPDYGKPAAPKRDAEGNLIDDADGDERRMTTTVSINGKELGDLNDLVANPTEELKDAFRGLVERAMPPWPTKEQEAVIEQALSQMPAGATLGSRLRYDYDTIDEAHREQVRAAAMSIHFDSDKALDGIIRMGKQMILAKEWLPHGQFGDWLKVEFGLSDRMAQNMMNVAREYGDPQKRNSISFFSPTVAYLLAAPSTPDEARAEVEQAAVEGKKVTVEFAKEVVQKHRPEPVQYAKVHQLETCVTQWLKYATEEIGTPNPDAILTSLKQQFDRPQSADAWLSKLCESLLDAEIVWRKSDLQQAINNVREQRRQAARQASARAVYVEPTPKVIESPGIDDDPMAAARELRLAEMAKAATEPTDPIVIALIHANKTDFDIALKNATVEQLEAAFWAYPADGELMYKYRIGRRRELLLSARDVAEMTAPAPEPPDSMIDPSWIVHTLVAPIRVDNADFVSALQMATLEQLREAIPNISTREPHYWDRLGAVRTRMLELVQAEQDAAYSGAAVETTTDEMEVHHMQWMGVLPPDPDEAAAIAIVEAERVEEDAQRAERDSQRASYERVAVEVDAFAIESVTITMPREIAEHLKRAAAAFKVGDMRLVDQAWLEEALGEALTREEA